MIKRIDHIGLSVANLERSMAFYQEAFKMRVASQGTFEPGKYGGMYEVVLGLPGATGRNAVLTLDALRLELFEFAYPTPRSDGPNRPVCDLGITHFGVEVVDIEAEYERLKLAGARFHCPPQKIGGLGAATYGRDPDGNVFELLEWYRDKGSPGQD